MNRYFKRQYLGPQWLGFALIGLLGTAASSAAGIEPAPLRAATAEGWYSYDVALQPGQTAPCCYNLRNDVVTQRGCELPSASGSSRQSISLNSRPTAAAVGSQSLRVYLRRDGAEIAAIQALGSDCPVGSADAVRPISGIGAEQSVQWLQSVAQDSDTKPALRDSAVTAIAFHAGAQATGSLRQLSSMPNGLAVRKQAVFWSALARGSKGADTVIDIARSDASTVLRKHAVFALTQSKDPRSSGLLRSLASDDSSAEIRAESLFWLAQSEGEAAIDDLFAAIRRDPSSRVRDHAVFALSQIGPQADAALIRLMGEDVPRAVKKKALFWLGQSGSDTALAFLDTVFVGK